MSSKLVRVLASAFLLAVVVAISTAIFAGSSLPNPITSRDATGTLSTFSTAGGIDVSNPFFQPLGTNGRSCSTCHDSSDAWTVTPADIQARFARSRGQDPIFRPNDGANCPTADVSTLAARRQAYSLLLNKGLIRISIPMPANAEFVIEKIDDPYDCDQTTDTQPAMYRRPLPSTNLKFVSAVMWDGRETVFGSVPGKSLNLTQSLTNQATDATLGHAQATSPPSPRQLAQIVAFETSLFTAQARDNVAGDLTADGATGGPQNVSQQSFHIGINDALGGDPSGAAFDPEAFTVYKPWLTLSGDDATPARQAVAHGEELFNTLPIAITGVGGLNDALGQATINGTCTTCHDTPNVGDHSFSVPLRIGTTDVPAVVALDISGLPVYSIDCNNGTEVKTTDPGRALISGKCADIGKVKGPILRGLAGRAPYFHNGSAATLDDVVEFYNERFNLNLSNKDKADLVAFLRTL